MLFNSYIFCDVPIRCILFQVYRRRPTRANHRQTTLGAWPRSRLEAIGGRLLLEAAWRLLVGDRWGYLGGFQGDLEGVLEAIEAF